MFDRSEAIMFIVKGFVLALLIQVAKGLPTTIPDVVSPIVYGTSSNGKITSYQKATTITTDPKTLKPITTIFESVDQATFLSSSYNQGSNFIGLSMTETHCTEFTCGTWSTFGDPPYIRTSRVAQVVSPIVYCDAKTLAKNCGVATSKTVNTLNWNQASKPNPVPIQNFDISHESNSFTWATSASSISPITCPGKPGDGVCILMTTTFVVGGFGCMIAGRSYSSLVLPTAKNYVNWQCKNTIQITVAAPYVDKYGVPQSMSYSCGTVSAKQCVIASS